MPRACPTLVATCVLVKAACAGPAATDAAPTPPATPGPRSNRDRDARSPSRDSQGWLLGRSTLGG